MRKLIALLLIIALCLGLVACGEKECDHDFEDATCSDPAECKHCGETKGKPKDHKFIEGDDGLECKYCGKSKQELNKDEEKTIAVIAKGETHAFWQALKAGAQQAADENGYKLTFQGPTSEEDAYIPQQQAMLQAALDNDVDGIVLATIGDGFGDMLTQAYKKKIPIVTFDSGLKYPDEVATGKNPIVAHIGFDNKASGAINAEKLFEAVKGEIAMASADEPYVVGVIQHDMTSTGYDRATGFVENFKTLADADPSTKGKYSISTEVKAGPTDNAYYRALLALCDRGSKAIYMTNEGVVNQVYVAFGDNPGEYENITFTGFDAGTNQINWVADSSNLIGSVANNSYQMGYEAVMQCIAAVEGGDAASLDIPGVWYDSSNWWELLEKNIVYMGSHHDKESLLNSTTTVPESTPSTVPAPSTAPAVTTMPTVATMPTATEAPKPTQKVMTYDEYAAADMDADVVVETYVQATQSWWEGKITVYCQSEDGAYFVYELKCSEEDSKKMLPGTKIRITGVKGEWAGEVEIIDGTFEFVEGETFIAKPFNATGLLGTDDLIKHQNEKVVFKGLTFEKLEYQNGEPGKDIYVTFKLDGKEYSFCVESYLTAPDSDLYKAVGELKKGDVVDVEGFLYWYEGANPHIIGLTKY